MEAPADRRNRASSDTARQIAERDRAWVERIRTGDVQAFEAMYRAYKNDLGAFVATYVGSGEAAEDLIHDLFLRVWENRYEWDPTVALNVYLFRAARNRALGHLRHLRVEAKFQQRMASVRAVGDAGTRPPNPMSADAQLWVNELEAAIERAVAALPERRREVFRLNRYHHLTYAEVADVLGISAKTVEVHMGLALAALREQFATWR